MRIQKIILKRLHLEQVRNRFRKGSFLHAVVLIGSGTTFAQIIVLAFSPILTRIYSPQDLGLLGIYTSIIYTILSIASLRYELAIPLLDNDHEVINMLGVCFVILLAITGTSTLVLFLFSPLLLDWLNAQALRPYLWIFPVSLLGVGTYQIFNFWALRKESFRSIAKAKSIQGISQVIAQILLGWIISGPFGLIMGDAVARLTGSGTLLKQFLNQDRKHLKTITKDDMGALAKHYWRFPIYSGSAALINRIAGQVPILLFAAFLGSQATGYLTLTQRAISLPMNLIGLSIAQVYFSRISQLIRIDIDSLRRLFWKVIFRLFLLGIIPSMILIAIGPQLFSLVFGPEWAPAGYYARFMGIMLLMQVVVVPISQTLNALEHQKIQFAWDILRLIFSILSILIPYYFEWTALATVGLYSMTMFFLYLFYLGLCHKAISNLTPINA